MIEIRLPISLGSYCDCPRRFSIDAISLADLLANLEVSLPALFRSICDDRGVVRKHINVFVNTRMIAIREADGLNQPLTPGDIVTIWTAVSGG